MSNNKSTDNLIIKIDHREVDLIDKIKSIISQNEKYKNIQIQTELLELADIIININDVDILLIERKTIKDLNASIKDGRYREQSYRLNGLSTHNNHNIIYLIEGGFNISQNVSKYFSHGRINKYMIMSSFISLICMKGFSMMRTFCIDETADLMCNTIIKLNLEFNKGNKLYNTNGCITCVEKDCDGDGDDSKCTSVPEPDIESEVYIDTTDLKKTTTISTQTVDDEQYSCDKDYINVVNKQKNKNITVNNISEIMLCQIPQIGSSTSKAIMDKFKTFPKLISALTVDISCLDDIKIINGEKSMKISKTIKQNLIKFILQK
jgi:ERCC4-type nuclease